jgi:hypothetical protein
MDPTEYPSVSEVFLWPGWRLTIGSQPEYKHIMGYLLMSKVLDLFKTDLFLNSVTESSKIMGHPRQVLQLTPSMISGISMPMGAYIPEGQSVEQQASPAVMSVLADAEEAFQSYLADRGQTGNVEDVRDAVMSVALLKVYQSSLGQNASALTLDTVDLLGRYRRRLSAYY